MTIHADASPSFEQRDQPIPLFGDFSKGFPPTLLSSGSRDLFLSNTVRMHSALRKAEVPADLHVQEAAPYGEFRGPAPEAEDLTQEVRDFVEVHNAPPVGAPVSA